MTPLIPAGGSCCNLLKSLINLFLTDLPGSSSTNPIAMKIRNLLTYGKNEALLVKTFHQTGCRHDQNSTAGQNRPSISPLLNNYLPQSHTDSYVGSLCCSVLSQPHHLLFPSGSLLPFRNRVILTITE